MRLCVHFVGLAVLAMSTRALAQEHATPASGSVRFSYAAAEACPTKNEFSHLVSDRGVSLSESAGATRMLDVTMDADPMQSGRWRGSFRISSTSNPGSMRAIEGASCAEVAHSLAIFTALALAPLTNDASTTPQTAPASTAEAAARPSLELPLLLHRQRFMIEANTRFFKSTADFENAAGAGLAASYFFSDAFGLRVDATYLSTVNAIPIQVGASVSPTPPPPQDIAVIIPLANEARAKVMLGPELDVVRAHGTLMGPHANPFDLFFRAEVGAIWTRYQRDPTMSFEPNPACEVDVGGRLFITPSVALSLEAGWFLYDDHYRAPSAVLAQEPTFPASTAKARMGPVAELGFELFLPEPK